MGKTTNMSSLKLCSSLVLVLFVASTVSATSCPDGWQGHKGACYHYMKETFSWFDALQVCNDQGGYLAEPTAQDQLVYLQGMMMDHAGDRGIAWIGMEDFAEKDCSSGPAPSRRSRPSSGKRASPTMTVWRGIASALTVTACLTRTARTPNTSSSAR